MKIKGAFAVAVFGATLLASGCATIVGGGSNQTINIDSNPKGASILLGHTTKDGVVGLMDTGKVTPAMISVPRKDGAIVLKKEGYKDTAVTLTRTINGWFFGNAIIGGLLGSSIDSSTGAIHRYDKDGFFAEMQAN